MPLGAIIRLLLGTSVCRVLVEDVKIIISGSAVPRVTTWTNVHSRSLGVYIYLDPF